MDNEISNNNQTSKPSSHITNAETTRLSSSSSSSSESSVDTIDKEQLVIETKQVVVSASEIDINNRNSSVPLSATYPNPNANNSQKNIVQGGMYDPNRIPASVFTSKAGTPMEWSVASNESLFSIHMGNTSFSRDHFFMLFKSGEIPKLDFDQPMVLLSGSNTPPIPSENTERTSEVNNYSSKLMSDEESLVDEPELPASNTKSISLDPEKIVSPDKNHVEEFRNSCSSTQSFQFPLLEVGGNSIKGTEKLHSPKSKVLSEQVEQQKGKPEPEPRPRLRSTPSKRSTWLFFFSCCSATN